MCISIQYKVHKVSDFFYAVTEAGSHWLWQPQWIYQALNTGTAPKTNKDLIGAQKAKKVLIRDQTLSWT